MKPKSKTTRGGTRKKRRSGAKLVFKDRVNAVIIAAVLIGIAVIVSGTIFTLRRLRPADPSPAALESPQQEKSRPEPESEPASGVAKGSPAAPVSGPARGEGGKPKPPPDKPAEPVARPASPRGEKPSAEKPRERAAEQPAERVPAERAPAVKPAERSPVERKPAEGPAEELLPERPSPEEPSPAVLPRERVSHKGSLAFVIDDAGNNLWELDAFLKFPGPLTIAVLPGLPHSAEAARRIRESGKEVFLHQPMEALGGQNPGPAAIYSGMSEGEIRAVLDKNLAELGPVAGLNNHQGSKITMDEKAMEVVLSVCRERGIYFLDSRTTAETTAPGLAKRMGVKIGERDVFVDNTQEKVSFIRAIREGMDKAEKKGSAVMIGHTWSAELAATLEELYPEMVEEGYSLTTISKFMMGKIDDEGFGY